MHPQHNSNQNNTISLNNCLKVTSRKAGFGSVREVCEFLMVEQCSLETQLEPYLK
jgi:3-deoxy-D-manno-octulosonate 8-phosphate phosphatase KdsC-like HAD superfamily phosphatase